jgi:hypothetical protein
MQAPKRTMNALSDVSNTHQSLLLHREEQHNNISSNSGSKTYAFQTAQQQTVVVTSSGFRGPAKQQLQHLASRFGATYSGQLVQGHTTHLVSGINNSSIFGP